MTTQANGAVADNPAESTWKERKLKFLAEVRTSNVDKHIVDGENPVSLCNYTDVYYNEYITSDLPFMQATATDSEVRRFGLKEGQVLLTKDSESWDDIAVPACVAETMPDVVCGYHLAIVDPIDDEVDGRFLAWLAQSPVLNDQFKLAAKGVTRFGLSQYALKNAVAKLPPLAYQEKVADFLDRKTAEIDTLIAKKRRLLDLLAEKRTALITRAVTKGLNPDVPMKDSGIEWLGEIPSHWQRCKLRNVLVRKIINGLYKPESEKEEAGTPFVQMGEAFGSEVYSGGAKARVTASEAELEKWGLRSGDLLFARRSIVFEGSGRCTRIGEIEEPHLFESSMILVRPNTEICFPPYLHKLFESRAMRAQVLSKTKTVTISGLDGEQLKSLNIVLPPVDEQEAIVEELERNDTEYKNVVGKTEFIIQHLKEYRSALITNAVTGQIQVA